MAAVVNLNADMAEGFGAYDIGNDDGMVKVVRSANIACGFHGGDWNSMHRVCQAAKAAGCSIGAHPGFNDLWGFGRRVIRMATDDVERMIAYQIGALQAIAAYSGLKVTHLKVHGSLSNIAATELPYALAIGRAIRAVDKSIIYVAQASTEMEKAGHDLGLKVAREGFADRQYEADLTLASRTIPGTVFHQPARAAEQAVRMVTKREVLARNGAVVALDVDTICIHGDEPTGVAVATAVRDALKAAGVKIVPLPEMTFTRRRKRIV
jgi:5-oxoprolinase (ATP-hydrolysing) subunit A